ncbi:MAG: hypothetical protein H6592_03400 [Flavobacteriales bacterium]|nr:hypothetical protein [Flavobacteriales bacterium]
MADFPSSTAVAMKAHLVTATDIAQWANTLESRALLPKLIRKLAVASRLTFKAIRFTSDEGVQEPDWDGFLDSPERSTYIPKGQSGWELSVQKSVRAKADRDLALRAGGLSSSERMKTTYVCVTARRWPEKKSWVKAHNAKGHRQWRKVIAYDATDIETWLESAPDSVQVWFSELLGKKPQEVASINAAWSSWADVSKRPLTPRLMMAGRGKQVDQLLGQLNGPPQVVLIKGDTREEVQAFVLAAIMGTAGPENEANAARTLILKSRAAWDIYSLSISPMVLVAMFDDRSGIERTVRAGHTVVIPMDRSDASEDSCMQLPPINRAEAAEALKEMGCKAGDIRALAFAGHRSLMSLRRQLADVRSVYEPRWARSAAADILIPALLASSWSEGTDRNEGDRKIMETLSGQGYEDLRSELLKWADEPDAPVRLVDKTWYVVSQEDLWAQVRKRITSENLQSFGQVVVDVLKCSLPSLGLPPDERMYAQVRGLHPNVSEDLRRGLVESLAFMGARGGGIKLGDGSLLDAAPARILHEVLSAANADWRIWASLSDQLPAFAEAAPEVFINAVQEGLKCSPSPFGPLFSQEEGAFFGRSYYVGLIWALETLAWKSDHLASSSDALAGLIPLDPIKKQTNRPLDSLYHVMQPWVQNCNSSVDERLKVMGVLRQRRPSEGYLLFIEMMPDHSRAAWHYTHTPRWRDWFSERRTYYTGEDVNAVLDTVSAWLIEDTRNDPDRCVQLCGCLDRASRPFFEETIKHLSNIDLSSWSGEQRMAVWDVLRDLHTRHTTYRKRPATMSRDLLKQLQALMNSYEPLDPLLRFRWLFTGSQTLPAEDVRGYEEVEARLTAEAAESIIEHYGADGVCSMNAVIDRSGLFGDACGRVALSDACEFALLNWSVNHTSEKVAWFGRAFVSARHRKCGWDWVDSHMSRQEWLNWTDEKKATFFASIPFEPGTWQRVASMGESMYAAYWRTSTPQGVMDVDQSLFAAERFLENDKPLRSLVAILRHGRGEKCEGSTEFLTKALENCVRTYMQERSEVWMPEYTVTEAHEILSKRQDIDRQRVALIEWQFFDLLERKDLVLYEEMARDPEPFADVLSYMNRSIQDPERIPTEQEGRLITRAYAVIKGWKGMPAARSDGSISEEGLETWYRKAVAAVAARGRMWSDYPLGEKLRYAPADPDGTWPCLAVRNLIEKLQSDDLERGVEIAVYNVRGLSAADGGHSERTLSERYEAYARAVEFTHLRTAAMLRRIAQDFTSSARFWEKRQQAQQAVEYHMG